MSAELSAISAVVARLADPVVNLAAYGSVVFPLALIIEAPVIMLLAASTALSRDWQAYVTLRRYMMVLGAVMTALHLVIAVTPVFDLIVRYLISAPEATWAPARIGFLLMLPWTWSIAYRRFNQGVLIRFGHSKAVSVGTGIRMVADVVVLSLGFWLGSVPGIVVATLAVSSGVLSEALYVGLRVRPVLRSEVKEAPAQSEPVTIGSFLAFYVPLALTSFLTLVIQPMASASLSRMKDPLSSLAVWPVVWGLMFMLRCLGHAYQEVTVALLDQPDSYRALRNFALLLSGTTALFMVILTATPLSSLWFERVAGLQGPLAELAKSGLWFGILLPGMSAVQNWLQGVLVHGRRTRSITESVGVFLVSCAVGLGLGAWTGAFAGLYVGLVVFTVGYLLQVSWLAWRAFSSGATNSGR